MDQLAQIREDSWLKLREIQPNPEDTTTQPQRAKLPLLLSSAAERRNKMPLLAIGLMVLDQERADSKVYRRDRVLLPLWKSELSIPMAEDDVSSSHLTPVLAYSSDTQGISPYYVDSISAWYEGFIFVLCGTFGLGEKKGRSTQRSKPKKEVS